MLIRALIVLLLVLNLGVAAWWALRPSPPMPALEPAIGGAPLLRLAGEASTTPDADEDSDPDVGTGKALPAGTRAAACHRYGPFEDEESGTAAVARLEPRVVAVRLRREWPGAGDRWRVILPTAGVEAGIEAAERIAEAGFEDYYVMREGLDTGTVALGMYGARVRADTRVATLREAGFEARVEPVGGGDPEFWAIAAVPEGFDAGAAGSGLGTPQIQEVLDCAGLVRVEVDAAR